MCEGCERTWVILVKMKRGCCPHHCREDGLVNNILRAGTWPIQGATDRIKAVLLKSAGWTNEAIAQTLLIRGRSFACLDESAGRLHERLGKSVLRTALLGAKTRQSGITSGKTSALFCSHALSCTNLKHSMIVRCEISATQEQAPSKTL
jgi:hypothetical protein